MNVWWESVRRAPASIYAHSGGDFVFLRNRDELVSDARDT